MSRWFDKYANMMVEEGVYSDEALATMPIAPTTKWRERHARPLGMVVSDTHFAKPTTPVEPQLITRFLVGFGAAELKPGVDEVIMGGDIVHTLKPQG